MLLMFISIDFVLFFLRLFISKVWKTEKLFESNSSNKTSRRVLLEKTLIFFFAKAKMLSLSMVASKVALLTSKRFSTLPA